MTTSTNINIHINTNTSMITPMNMMEKTIAMRIRTAIPTIMAMSTNIHTPTKEKKRIMDMNIPRIMVPMSTTIRITRKILINIPIEKEE